MKITIIGSGHVGAALGQGFLRSGHQVSFGVRDVSSVKAEAAKTLIAGAIVQSIEEACQSAEVIIITIPSDAILSLIPQLGDTKGKIIVDATNSVRTRPEPFPTAFHAIKELTKSEKVIKCFNTTGFENMIDPVYPSVGGVDMFCAGNDQKSKVIVQQLAKDLGFSQCWDFGGDGQIELLEKWALCWINLAMMQGYGRGIAVKILTR
jgi:8-hydroxy-5-deazaflavin:NADPH oxidoreductase